MLNNKGWGLSTFLGFAIIFLVFIFIISVNAYKIGLSKNSPGEINFNNQNTNYTYSNIETTVKEAGKRYIQTKKDDVNYVTITELISERYLSILTDNNGNTCTGYVKVNTKGNEKIYLPYIKCGTSYQTNGYDTGLDN